MLERWFFSHTSSLSFSFLLPFRLCLLCGHSYCNPRPPLPPRAAFRSSIPPPPLSSSFHLPDDSIIPQEEERHKSPLTDHLTQPSRATASSSTSTPMLTASRHRRRVDYDSNYGSHLISKWPSSRKRLLKDANNQVVIVVFSQHNVDGLHSPSNLLLYMLRYFPVSTSSAFGGVFLQSPSSLSSDQREMFSMYLFPGSDHSKKDVIKKEVLFVVDVSGSMKGRSIEATKTAVMIKLFYGGTNMSIALDQSIALSVGTEIISEEILASCAGGPRGNEQYASVFVALVAGLACLVGIDFGAKLLALLAKCFESAQATKAAKRIMKLDKDINKINSDALFVISNATELFIKFLAEKSSEVAIEKKRKTIKLEHMRIAVKRHQTTTDFLLDSLPMPPPAQTSSKPDRSHKSSGNNSVLVPAA
ncbi:hypothetical protein L2E82_50825 [Cichorium intybus]|nr:hypothetical protein L2E82_50825 [Cichorium intybus]